MTAENKRKVQVAIEADGSDAKRAMGEVGQSAKDLARDVNTAGAAAGKSFDGIGTGADGAAQKVDRTTKRLIDSIQRTTAATEAGGRSTAAYFETLAQQRGVNADALRPYLTRLREVEAAQNAASKSMGGTAVSAAQMSAALRNVPAQFTDIAVSLASGQQPLTVLLQQGGQLKDMFGGIGPAAQALGRYIVGLVNPLSIAAVGAGTLFAAFQSGSNEITKLTQAVILSGEKLGVTAGQLQDIAASVAGIGAGTQGAASEFLGIIARDAKVAATDLQRFTAAALEMERAGGPAAEATAKAFADLGKEPLQASIKLTEQYNYLTQATYEQIKALEEQGKTTEAAAVAQRAYADFLEQRQPAMLAALGGIERAWIAIKTATTEAWDRLKQFGRDTTISQQYAELSQSIKDIEGGKLGQRAKSDLPALREQANELRKQLELEQAGAIESQRRAEINSALSRLTKFDNDNLDKKKKLTREIVEFEKDALKVGRDREYIERGIAAIKAKYADKNGASRQARDIVDPLDAEAMRAYAKGIEEFKTLSLSAADSADKLSKSQAKLREIQSAPTWAEYSRQQQEQLIYAASLAQTEETRAAAMKENARIAGEAAREYRQWLDQLQRGTEQAEKQVEALRNEAEAQALVIPGYRSLETALVMVEIARLRERQAASIGNEDAVLAIEREINAREKLVEVMSQRDVRRTAEEQAKRTADDWQRTADSIRDSLTDALMRGFEGGKDAARNMRDTIVNMFRTMVLRPVIQAVVNPVAMAITGGMGATSAQANIIGQQGGSDVAQSVQQLYKTLTGSFESIGTNVAMAADKMGEWLVTNTTGTLNKAGGTLMQYAGTIGSIGESVAGAAAGMGLRRAIGGKYEISSGFSTFQDVGVAVASAIGGPVFGAIAGAVAGLVNRAFGRKPKEITEQGIEGSFSGGDAMGEAYATWQQKGGWFRSTKRGTDRTALDAEMADALDAGALAVFAQTRAWADALSLPADQLAQVTSSFKVKLTDDVEANKAAITEAIKAYGEELARTYAGVLQPLQRGAESLTETLSRVAGLERFSKDLNQLGGVFSRVANLGMDVRESFISMAGGMDQLMANALGFAQNYYSREEIAGLKAGEIQRSLVGAGISGAGELTGREDFRRLVESIDVSTESGRQQLATLLSVQGAFVDVADYLAETGATLAEAARAAPEAGALTSLITPMERQADASNALANGMNNLGQVISRLIEVVRTGNTGALTGNAASSGPAFSEWSPEVIDYSYNPGGA